MLACLSQGCPSSLTRSCHKIALLAVTDICILQDGRLQYQESLHPTTQLYLRLQVVTLQCCTAGEGPPRMACGCLLQRHRQYLPPAWTLNLLSGLCPTRGRLPQNLLPNRWLHPASCRLNQQHQVGYSTAVFASYIMIEPSARKYRKSERYILGGGLPETGYLKGSSGGA